ncbi:MAG TPA: YceI family protein [Chloroflexota bacterium]|nr:YceI family protein [Chloroflexota bacterium]
MAWEYDPNLSKVEWAVGYLGIATIKGRFTKVQARLNVDDPDPCNWSVDATIDAASLFSGHQAMDDHVRSSDFLDVDTFPTIAFKTARVERTADAYRMIGSLTLHGVTREVALEGSYGGEATDARGRTKRGFSARATLRRSDFGIRSGMVGDRSVAGEEIRVSIDVVANKAD